MKARYNSVLWHSHLKEGKVKGNIKAFLTRRKRGRKKGKEKHITFSPRHSNVSTISHWWDPLSLCHPFDSNGNIHFNAPPLSQGVLPTSVQTWTVLPCLAWHSLLLLTQVVLLWTLSLCHPAVSFSHFLSVSAAVLLDFFSLFIKPF